jgi:hypothetical protein
LSRRARFLRIGLGFLLAPLTPVLLLLAISLGSGGIAWRESVLLIEIGVPAVYAPAVALGIPMFAVLHWRRWDGLMAYVVAAALIGVIVWLLYGLAVPGRSAGMVVSLMRQARGFLPLVVACSVAVSAAFWMIVRPDRFGDESQRVDGLP